MDRGTSAYAPLTSRRRLTRRLFRSVRLNRIGWSAVSGIVLAGAALGYALGSLAATSAAIAVGALGGMLAFSALMCVDRRKWGRLTAGYSWTDDASQVEMTCVTLQGVGLAVTCHVDPAGGASLRYKNRDRARVFSSLRDLGIPTP